VLGGREQEATLEQDLSMMRQSIDKYTLDEPAIKFITARSPLSWPYN
jgi:hypothetical protein